MPTKAGQLMGLSVLQDERMKSSIQANEAVIANELCVEAWRSESLQEEIQSRKERQEAHQRKLEHVLRLQRVIRGWLKRKKYLLHKNQLQSILRRLQMRQQHDAVLKIQCMVRSRSARRELRQLREQKAQRIEEEESKKKKKKGKKKTAAAEEAPLDPKAQLVKDNETFIKAYVAYSKFQYDEAISVLEKSLKKGEDKVAERLLERCRCGKATLLAEAKAAKEKEGKRKSVSKAGGSAKGAGKKPGSRTSSAEGTRPKRKTSAALK